jgi:exodeoxyribonuclease III
MKLATWNINSIRARQERLCAWLAQHQPDVLCLQETKVIDDGFPVAALQECGYSVAVHGQRTYNGVAILSREPLRDIARGFGDGEPDDDARLIAASHGDLRVISVYVPNGAGVGTDKYYYKLRWLERLRAYLDRNHRPDQPVVLSGDFNVAPDDRDVYDPVGFTGQLMCTNAERKALEQLVAWGFTDAVRLHHDEPGLFSWWDYRQLAFPRNRGVRIDMIYLSAPVVPRCTAASIDRQARKGKAASDHAPVMVELAD